MCPNDGSIGVNGFRHIISPGGIPEDLFKNYAFDDPLRRSYELSNGTRAADPGGDTEPDTVHAGPPLPFIDPPRRIHADAGRNHFPLQYLIMQRIGRRLNSDPRERLYFNLPLVSYSDYHRCFRHFKRIELDGKNADQLAERGFQKNGLDVGRAIKPAPRTETRELWLWDGSQPGAPGEFDDCSLSGDIADFLAFQCLHLRSVVGHGHIRRIRGGDLAFVYHIRARFFQNPDLHSRRVKVWFSYSTQLTTGRTKRNPHTTLNQTKRNYMDRTARFYGRELLALGFKMDPDFFSPARRGRVGDGGGVDVLDPPAEPSSARDSRDARHINEEAEMAELEREEGDLRRLQEEAEAESSGDSE